MAEAESGPDMEALAREYTCVGIREGVFGGWKREMLCEEVSGSEERLVICVSCKGLLREACEVKRRGRQELMCYACIQGDCADVQPTQTIRDVIAEKKVFCPLDDCKWSGRLNMVLGHLGECPFVPIPCPLKCVHEKEGVKKICMIKRCLISQHKLNNCSMRLVTCESCQEEVRACEVNLHLSKCEHYLTSCPNTCSEDVRERKDIKTHLVNSSPLEVVECPYVKFGCEVTLPRTDIEQHEKDDCYLHNRMMCQRFDCMSENIRSMQENAAEVNLEMKNWVNQLLKSDPLVRSSMKQLEKENNELKQEMENLKKTLSPPSKGVSTWCLTRVAKKIENGGKSDSEPFYAGLYRFKITLDWKSKRKYIGVYMQLIRGDWDDKIFWPVRYRYKISILYKWEEKNVFEYESTNFDINENPTCFANPSLMQAKLVTTPDNLLLEI